jgi:hypothetical protein
MDLEVMEHLEVVTVVVVGGRKEFHDLHHLL